MATCDKCAKPIPAGQFIEAMGKKLHMDCFRCGHCDKLIGASKFSIDNGTPYHSDCLSTKKGDVCCQCSKPLGAGALTALNKQWHADCFTCGACKKAIATGKFLIKSDVPYHPECVPNSPPAQSNAPATLCAGCNQAMALGSSVITVFDKPWHPDCFKCGTCNLPIREAEFKVDGQKAFHRNCRIGPTPTCMGCSSPIIEKKFIEALDGTWHLGCFKCAVCGLLIEDGSYKVEGNAPVHSHCKEDTYEVTETWVTKDGKEAAPATKSLRKGIDGPTITPAEGSPAGSPKAKAKAAAAPSKPGAGTVAKGPASKPATTTSSARPSSATTSKPSTAASPKSSALGSPTAKPKPSTAVHATTASARPASASLSSPKGAAKSAPKPKAAAH
eukprot:GGOE01044318.1.p1 GENE.GGOE01044318.1~~GGOE01044318.1.p1  ORF type:complete len:400 (+),score=93.07 GGOE01044318.1:42-1202(+)